MKNLTALALVLSLIACGSKPTPTGGGMTQVDPPDPNLNSGDNLPLTSDREDLDGTANPNLWVQTLCLENQGFGDHYAFDGWSCLGGSAVLRLTWNTVDGLGIATDTEAFTLTEVSDGTLDDVGVIDLPGYTGLVLTGSGTSGVTSVSFRFDDGPSIRDVVVE